MKTFKEYLNEQKSKGTYAAVIPSAKDSKLLSCFKTKHELVNDEPLHCTLLYSRKYLPKYKPDPELTHVASIKKLEVWPKHKGESNDDGENYLVAILSSESLQDRYKELTDEHGATSDYDKYIPHVTLACMKRNFDVDDYDLSELPKTITLSDEYMNDLDLSEEE